MTNAEINQQVNQIFENMNNRKKLLISDFMGSEFPTEPLMPLSEIQAAIDEWNNNKIEGKDDEMYDQLIARYQALIDNNQYCIPGTPEYTYMENYRTKLATFSLPQSEIDLRDADLQQVLALQKQLNPNEL